MAISSYLKGVADQLTGQAQKKIAQGQASTALQTQQALTAAPATAPAKQAAQQMAPQIAGAQNAIAQQATQEQAQQTQAATGAALQAAANQQVQNLQQKALVDEKEISDLQRQGKLKQNAAELDQAKQIEEKELAEQQRRQVQGIAFDNRVSFLTRKQREDLASLGSLAKQQIFDSRLQFAEAEGKRKFTNMRQLADYATASAASEEVLKSRLTDMQQAYTKEVIALEAAQKMLTQQLTLEMKRSEAGKDNALALELARAKAALEQKLRRKKAQAAGNAQMIQGAFTIAGAVVGTYAGNPALGAAAGSAVGGAVASEQAE